MQDFLSKEITAIIKKYQNSKPIEKFNGKEICAIDKDDLDCLLSYSEESLRLQSTWRKKPKLH